MRCCGQEEGLSPYPIQTILRPVLALWGPLHALQPHKSPPLAFSLLIFPTLSISSWLLSAPLHWPVPQAGCCGARA